MRMDMKEQPKPWDENYSKFADMLDGKPGYTKNKLGKYEAIHPVTLRRILNSPEVKGTEIEDVIMFLLFWNEVESIRVKHLGDMLNSKDL